MSHVLIIEAQIKQYRAPFYAELHEKLSQEGIELTVAYSDPPRSEVAKKDTCDLPAAYGLKVPGYWLLPERLVYQPLFGRAARADLIIVDQGNRFFLNHILLPLSRVGLRRVAFWGLGQNLQAGQLRFSEWYRRLTLNWVSWWFAYTQGTAQYLRAQGVPPSKITAVQNAVDTRDLRQQVKNFRDLDRGALRERLGIAPRAEVGIFCGMLDKVKAVPFLIESAKIVKAQRPDFHLILAGGGPDQQAIHELVAGFPWIHPVGPCFGNEKARYFAISDCFLMPGRVGLAVLDAFAAGLPLLTTRLNIHGPEFEYLEPGVNGLVCHPDPQDYAKNICSLFAGNRLGALQAGADASSQKYSIENMAANFHSGIQSCFETCGPLDVSHRSLRRI